MKSQRAARWIRDSPLPALHAEPCKASLRQRQLSAAFAQVDRRGHRFGAGLRILCLSYRKKYRIREVTLGQPPLGTYAGIHSDHRLLLPVALSCFSPKEGELAGTVLNLLLDAHPGRVFSIGTIVRQNRTGARRIRRQQRRLLARRRRPYRIDSSGKLAPKSGPPATGSCRWGGNPTVASRALPVGAPSERASSHARALGLLRHCGADGVCVSVAHDRAGAPQIHRLAHRPWG